jgi:hypothetical protein
MRAVEETIETVCTKEGVRCVSFKQLADWLDAQDAATLAKLRTLDVGRAPKEGWAAHLAAQASGTARTRGTAKDPGTSDTKPTEH